MVYRDGQSGRLYAKRFKIGGVTRDKEYPLFKTHSKSRVFFFSVHDSDKKNSRVLVHIDPELKRVKEKVIEFDFAWLDLQGRSVKGSTLTAHKVDRVVNAPKLDEAKEPNSEINRIDETKQNQSQKQTTQITAEESTKDGKTGAKQTAGDLKDQATFDFPQG